MRSKMMRNCWLLTTGLTLLLMYVAAPTRAADEEDTTLATKKQPSEAIGAELAKELDDYARRKELREAWLDKLEAVKPGVRVVSGAEIQKMREGGPTIITTQNADEERGEANNRIGIIGTMPWSFEVWEILGPTEVLAKFENWGPFVLAGIRTEGMVTTQTYAEKRPLQITGTRTYGAETVYVFEVLDQKIIDEYFDAKREKKRDKRRSPALPKWKTEYRTWKDASGKFSVKAKYSGITAGKVVLIAEDGRKLQVPKDQLSEEDRKLLE